MTAAAAPAAAVLSWVALTALTAALPAQAQQYGLYLRCQGTVQSGGKAKPAHLDLALRRNSELAVIQASDVLPAGYRMKLGTTPQFYTMNFDAPLRGSVVWHDWLRGALFVWNPDLRKLHAIRISVDRQSAALEGDMRDGAGVSVGRLAMQCEPSDNETAPEPKF